LQSCEQDERSRNLAAKAVPDIAPCGNEGEAQLRNAEAEEMRDWHVLRGDIREEVSSF
jgi:hypothetical protein